jgi:hypothetical protein
MSPNPLNAYKNNRIYRTFDMEPTGIEPVTSCLQNDTADRLYGLIFRRVCGIAARAPPRGYGGIRRDQAGFGQPHRTAAQTIEVRTGEQHRRLRLGSTTVP